MVKHIYRGPTSENMPQVVDLPVAADTLPGTVVTISNNTLVAGGATTVGKVLLLQEQYILGNGVNDVVEAGQTGFGLELLPDRLYSVRVPASTAIALGQALSVGASGKVVPQSASRPTLFYAEQALASNASGDSLILARAALQA